MSIRAFLFDLDGTLLNTLADIAESLNTALEDIGLQPHPVEAYRNFVGDGAFELVRKAVPPAYQDDETVEQLLDSFRENYAENWSHQTSIYAGIKELLEELREQGIQTCVLSNKPDDFTRVMVEYFFGDHPFDYVMGHKADFPPKPDPESTLYMLEMMGIEREEAAYVGDMHIDMNTALNAGIMPIGVSWGFQDVDELRDAGAELIIYDPEELLDLI